MNFLKNIRQKSGMSQADLAKKSGVPLRNIQAYERGFRDLRSAQVDTVIKLAHALGVTVEDLFEID